MRRYAKNKTLATTIPLKKSALSASSAARRPFPAWIDSAEATVPLAGAVQPRVRSALILRKVGRKKSAGAKGNTHGPDAR